MRNILLAAVAAFGLLGSTIVMADDATAQQDQTAAAAAAAVDRQAAADGFADPTSSSSLRSHGHP